MTETGLLIAEAAFLVLLYLFIWSIVRSSSRDLRDAGPVVIAPSPDLARDGDTGSQRAVAVDAPGAGGAAGAAALTIPDDEPRPVAVQPDPGPPVTADRGRPTGPALDLSVNIRPRLIVERSPALAPGTEHPLDEGMTIGRSRRNGMPLADQFVSHLHARIYPQGQFLFIEDLGSTNGTFVNGRRIEEPTQLKVRDEISFGETVLRYEE